VCEKSTCQFQIKFITEDYLQMHKTLQVFTNMYKFNTNKFTSIKVIKNTYVQTQIIEIAKLIKGLIKLKCSLI
jgi:hypothetical protein